MYTFINTYTHNSQTGARTEHKRIDKDSSDSNKAYKADIAW